jgi:hypothetical protein
VKEARKEDEKAALIGFKKEPYRLFKRLLVTAEPEILVTYKDQQAMLTAQQSKTESAKVSKSRGLPLPSSPGPSRSGISVGSSPMAAWYTF